MKALAIAARDAAPQLQELPDPQPPEGGVLVAVEAASINGMDMAVVAGFVWDMLPHTFPVVLGRDFAGTVTELGTGVDGVRIGDRVAGVVPLISLGPGTIGELVNAPTSALTLVPDGVASAQAAAVGLAGVAAYDTIDRLDVTAGDVVLVSGATGGVGHIAVQLAAARGATVIATGKPGREDFLRSIGAAHFVDYTRDVTEQVAAVAPDGLDKAVHSAGDVAAVGATLRSGGALASTLGANAEQVGRDDVSASTVVANATSDKLGVLLRQVVEGRLRVHVSSTFPFERASEALAAFADGKVGKIVVTR